MNKDIKITTEDIKNNEDNIINIDFDSIEKEEYYTIKQVANKLNVGTNKVNHYIFTLNKHSKNNPIIQNSSKLTDDDIEILEIFIELRDKENMSYDDIAKHILEYIKKDSKTLLNKDTGELARPLNNMDTTLITNGLIKEVSKQTKTIENTLNNKLDNVVNVLSNSFEDNAKKIAQVNLEAMLQTKDEIKEDFSEKLNSVNNNIDTFKGEIKDDVESIKQKMIEIQVEGERLRTLRDAEVVKKSQLDMDRTKQEYEEKLKELENMSLFQRIFQFKRKK